jgi:putative FmdB family regulatory protein
MPLYEYQCEACSHRFEVIQKYSDAPVDACPRCAGAVRKLLSSPAIQFKGSGWYITDYARAGKSDSSDTGSTSGSKSEKSEKSETAPAGSDSKSTATSETKSESAPPAKASTSD